MPNVLQTVTVPVGITFDPCQGLREAKQKIAALRSEYGNEVKVEVVFDARHLELVTEYATIPDEFSLDQFFITGKGGLLNLTVPVNLLRVAGTLWEWRRSEFHRIGFYPIEISYIRPSPNTLVGQLWDVLGMEGLIKRPPQNNSLQGVMEFQSRYITPLLLVKKDEVPQADIKQNRVHTYFQNWIVEIEDRLGVREKYDLLQAIPEIVINVVRHGGGGLVGLSVWPSGQVEIIWSNPLAKTDPPWPPGDEPQVLAESLLASKSGGAGIKFITGYLLKQYSGVLVVNWRTHYLAFRSGGDISVDGLYPRSKEFIPRSILFNLHLFSSEVRIRSSRDERS